MGEGVSRVCSFRTHDDPRLDDRKELCNARQQRGKQVGGQATRRRGVRQGDPSAFDEIFFEGYVNHNIPVAGIPGTKAGFRQLVEATRHAFPDLKVHVEDIVAEDDLVVFHDHVTATSEGEFFGVPPSGKPLEWTEIHFLRVADGQIVEHWTNFDQLGILGQLSAIPG